MMKKLVLLIMIMCFALHGKATNYADYVNPLIGTQSTYEFSSGNTYPAIARPWGMNFWTPQTGKWETDGSICIQLLKSEDLNRPISPARGLMTTVSFPLCRW